MFQPNGTIEKPVGIAYDLAEAVCTHKIHTSSLEKLFTCSHRIFMFTWTPRWSYVSQMHINFVCQLV